MALRIGLLRSSALQNDGLDVPLILQCRTPQETNPKGHWGPNYFLRNSPINGDVDLSAGSEVHAPTQAVLKRRHIKKRFLLCAMLDNDAVSVSLCHFLPLLCRFASSEGCLCSDHRHLGEALIDSFQVHLGSQVRHVAFLLVNLAPPVLELGQLDRISHDRQLLACEGT
jgi:hypothetical protein